MPSLPLSAAWLAVALCGYAAVECLGRWGGLRWMGLLVAAGQCGVVWGLA